MTLGAASVRFTNRDDGDLGHGGAWVDIGQVAADVAARRRAVLDTPWSWVRQVHGDTVVMVDGPGGAIGETGDALVASAPGAALVVLVADCAPVAMVGDNGAYAAVHAGWRGLVAGVVEQAARRLRSLGADEVIAALGPCIHPECYEFSRADLDGVAARLGPQVRGLTSAGAPALDVPAAVRSALTRSDVELVHDIDVCTACSPKHYSYRAAGDTERQALVVHRAR